MIGFLPPSSNDTFLSNGAAPLAIAIPVFTEPITAILLISGCSTKYFPFSGPPVTTLIRPLGNISSSSSQNLKEEIGACSEFFIIKELPINNGAAIFSTQNLNGWLKGLIFRTTP